MPAKEIPTRRSTRQQARQPAGNPWRSFSPHSKRSGCRSTWYKLWGTPEFAGSSWAMSIGRPRPTELEKMKSLVREAMEAGAIGLSTALIYPPAVYASTDEIVALARVAGEYGGSYFTHMRNEGDRLLEAIDEALLIGKQAGTPVHIFHLKAAGKANWPKMDQALARIRARAG